MKRPIEKDLIAGLECKHAVCCLSQDGSNTDILAVKENIHTKDGKVIPNFHLIYQYPRHFYVTKSQFQNHNQLKEYEDLDKLDRFTTTQGHLQRDIETVLGDSRKGNRHYLYGSDITTPTLLKHEYQTRYPDSVSDNSVAVLDIETDVVVGHGRPIYIGVSFQNRAFIATTFEFLGHERQAEEKIQSVCRELLSEYVESRQIELEVQVYENVGQACYEAIKRVHAWQPDFLTIWNIDFDIPKIVQSLEEFGYNPADVFSDPSIPEKYRFFTYKQGPSQKKTASGQTMSLTPAERWHVAQCPASFTLIDSMCVYKRIRMAEQNEPSYSLDYQLQRHLGKRKLRFAEAENYTGLAWHEYMQVQHKIEYGAYNLFDCIGVELLDAKTKDLAQTISVQSGASEYSIFKSQPERLVNQFYFFCLERGKVLATRTFKMETELDKMTRPLDNIIVTLPSHLRVEHGIPVLQELPELRSEVYTHVADLDIVSSYPFSQLILNISKATTYREVCEIEGVSLESQLIQGIHLSAPAVNAYEIARTLYKAPTFDSLLESFEATFSLTDVAG